MENDSKKYKSRANFSTEEQQLILNNYNTKSAKKLSDMINEHRTDNKVAPSQIYNFLRHTRQLSTRYVELMKAMDTPSEEIEAFKESFNAKFVQQKRHRYGIQDYAELFDSILNT